MSRLKDSLRVKGGLTLLAAGHMMSDVYASFIVTLLPLWVRLFGLPFSAAGFLVFLRGAGMAVFEPLGGYVADRTAKLIFPFGLLVVALAMSSVGWAPNYSILILLVLMSTVGQSLFGPQATSTATHSSGGLKGLGLAIFLAGGSLGAAVGPIAVASLVNAVGLQRTWLMVLPGLLLSILLYKVFAPGIGTLDNTKRSLDILSAIDLGPTLALACVLLLRGAAETGIMAFLPLLIEQKGGGLIAIGATISLFKLSGAAGAIIASFLSDRRNWKPVVILSFVLAAIFLYSFLEVEGFMSLILVALLGAALLSSSPYTLVMAQRLLPERTSTAAGLVFSLSLLGGGLGALCEGFLADGLGVETALLIIGVTLPLGAAAATMGLRE
jgi:FSR family fosmidomycin resistance protein-like MFS transporter